MDKYCLIIKKNKKKLYGFPKKNDMDSSNNIFKRHKKKFFSFGIAERLAVKPHRYVYVLVPGKKVPAATGVHYRDR